MEKNGTICDLWLQFDDLSPTAKTCERSCVSKITTQNQLSKLFGQEFSKSAYMLFYELIDSRNSETDVLKSLRESTDLAFARRLQIEEDHLLNSFSQDLCNAI